MSKAAANHLTWHAMTAELDLVSTKQVSAQAQHHILLGLCAHTDPNGVAYPSQTTLGTQLKLSRTSVFYGLQELEKLGHIKALGTAKKSGLVTRWQVFPEVFAKQKARRYEADPDGVPAGQPAGQPAGLVAGLAQQVFDPNNHTQIDQTQAQYGANNNGVQGRSKAEVEVQAQDQAHLHESQRATKAGGFLSNKTQQEQTALIAQCVELDLRTRPPQLPAGKTLKAKMAGEYCAIINGFSPGLPDDQVISWAVAKRNGEPLYLPPTETEQEPYQYPDPEAVKRIKAMMAPLRKRV